MATLVISALAATAAICYAGGYWSGYGKALRIERERQRYESFKVE